MSGIPLHSHSVDRLCSEISQDSIRVNKRMHGPNVLCAVLVVAIAAQVAAIIKDAIASARDRNQSVAYVSPIQATTPRPRVDLDGIRNANLFGVRPDAAEVQHSRAPLVLSGTIAMNDPAQGLAIIGPDASSVMVRAVGSLVDGEARLVEVYADYVILERQNVRELLRRQRGDSNQEGTFVAMQSTDMDMAALAADIQPEMRVDASLEPLIPQGPPGS